MAAILGRAYALYTCFGLACGPGFDDDLGWSARASSAGCPALLAPHDLRDRGGLSPFRGQRVEVRGVVTLALERDPGPGFFMQSLAPDANAQSSEGLFVKLATPVSPAPGTLVRVRGVVAPSPHATEMGAVDRVDECGRIDLVAVPIDVRKLDPLEAWEGVWVEARADWAVVDAARSLGDAEVTASPDGRLFASGHELGHESPPAELWTIRSAGSARAAKLPPPRLDATRAQITGVLQVEGDTRRSLYTPGELAWSAKVPEVPARARAGSLRVVALNLDNYFVDLEASRAKSERELIRQRDKLVTALRALDADILALTELENRGSAALEHLLQGLDSGLPPARRYSFGSATPADGATLRAGIAYRPSRVNARGEAWFDEHAGFRRAPLFQSFESGAQPFTVGVVHFKSKLCDSGPQIIAPEGCGEPTRRSEAALLLDVVHGIDAADPGVPLLVVGDFNSDSLEAPMVALEGAGLIDVLGALPAPERYSYVFQGRASLLDHALAWGGFDRLIEGAAIWHINADEPAEDDARDDASAARSALRSSDHDPVVLDLRP